MGELLRAVASITATALGAVLLIADSTDECENYAGFKGSADYSSGCPELASGEGTLSLDWPPGDDATLVKQQLEESGLHVSQVVIDYDGSCSGGEGDGSVAGIRLFFENARSQRYYCDPLQLPVTEASTLNCGVRTTSDTQVSGDTPSCMITFRPPAN